MARAYSMKEAAERLDKLPALLTREGESPVVAILRRDHPVLAVLPWDLYVGLLQTLANLPDELAGTQQEGIRALLADATGTLATETPGAAPQNRPPHRRRTQR